jgi:tetratricopeptide (TPR) repeat protein
MLFEVRALVAAVLVGITACGHASGGLARYPDAPLQLRDDNDRDLAIDKLWVMPLGPARDAARAEVVAAITRRITDALEEDKPTVVETLVFQLVSLWQADPAEVGRGLAPHVELIAKLRASFAKAGAVEPALATLVLLAELEPKHRSEHLAEIDEILEFAAGVTQDDDDGRDTQPAQLLQPTVFALPLPWLVDRYVGLLEAHQHAVDVAFQHNKSFQIVGAAHDVLQTGRRIASALARGGRTREIADHVGKLEGLGADHGLAMRADAVAQGSSDAYADLARTLRSEEHGQVPDQAAALAVCLAGLARDPKDAGLLAIAGESSAALGRVEQPIELYSAALVAAGGQVDGAVALKLAKLYSERIARLAFGGRPGAATGVWHDLARYTKARSPNPVWAQVTAVAETALGRGLLSQGRLGEAEHELVASLDRAPSIDAYETLTTIYLKTDRLASASRAATAGLAMLGETSGDRYRRAKLERIAGDVMRTAGKSRDAAALYLDALRTWTSFGEDKNLPRTIAAERKLEFARGMWYLGNSDRAVDLVLEAIDIAPEASSLCSDAVAFLLEVGKPGDALDALHRGLGAPQLGELDKVYMCLWVLADARRRGEPHDRQAYEYLASRHGDLWYELLAEAATGRLDVAALRAAANTGPRQAELAFYGVVLGLDPATSDPATRRKQLERVVGARLVMDAEYDLARQYLATP